jgi:hypothetical protein
MLDGKQMGPLIITQFVVCGICLSIDRIILTRILQADA